MNFTYEGYLNLIELLKKNNYEICDYHNYSNKKKCVILRHDIDNSLQRAVKLAKIEEQAGVKSTYFVLLRTEFYNVASVYGQKAINDIISLGHEIGLHFDEMAYDSTAGFKVEDLILKDVEILSKICEIPITTVSMHRPSKETLERNLHIQGIEIAYERRSFHDFKYLSDSRRHWREPVEVIIEQEQYKRLQILTHAFWYHEKEKSLGETIREYVTSANAERYDLLSKNIRDIETILGRELL